MEPTTTLDLEQYAVKYGVSTSTLRRRIRSGLLKATVERGRYWIADEDSVKGTLFSRQKVKTFPTEAEFTKECVGRVAHLIENQPQNDVWEKGFLLGVSVCYKNLIPHLLK